MEHPEYLSAVQRAWNIEVHGVKMFQVWVKMKQVRENLRGLHKVYHHASLKVLCARTDRDIDSNQPCNFLHWILSCSLSLNLAQKELDKWYGVEEQILKQKSKIHWLQRRDGNNSFCHASLKSRRNSSLSVLYDQLGHKLVEEDDIKAEVDSFYKGLLGTTAHTTLAVDVLVVRQGAVLNATQRAELVKHVSAKEVYDSLCSIGENKAPGADGFSSRFFKSTWHLIGDK